mgnify:CR=1 FL=1
MFQILGVTSKRSGLAALILVLAWCLGSIVHYGPPLDGWLQLRSPVLTPPFGQKHPMNVMGTPGVDSYDPDNPLLRPATKSDPSGCIQLRPDETHQAPEIPFCRKELPDLGSRGVR